MRYFTTDDILVQEETGILHIFMNVCVRREQSPESGLIFFPQMALILLIYPHSEKNGVQDFLLLQHMGMLTSSTQTSGMMNSCTLQRTAADVMRDKLICQTALKALFNKIRTAGLK